MTPACSNAQYTKYDFTHPIVDLDTTFSKTGISAINVVYLYYSWCEKCKETLKTIDNSFSNGTLNRRIKFNAYEFPSGGKFYIKNSIQGKDMDLISGSPVIFVYSSDECLRNQLDFFDKRIRTYKYNKNYLILPNTTDLSGLISRIDKEMSLVKMNLCDRHYSIPAYFGFGINSRNLVLGDISSLKSNEGTIKQHMVNVNIGGSFQYKLAKKEKSSYFSIALGIEFNINFISFASDSMMQTLNGVDPDNEQYLRKIKVKNYSESDRFLFLNIPLTLKYNLKINRSVMLGFGITPALALKLTESSERSGTFSQSGYYEKYGWLYNSTRLGFAQNVYVVDNTKIGISGGSFLIRGQADISFNLFKRAKGMLGLNYNLSFMKATQNPVVVSNDFKTINSPLVQKDHFTLGYFGAILGLKF